MIRKAWRAMILIAAIQVVDDMPLPDTDRLETIIGRIVCYVIAGMMICFVIEDSQWKKGAAE